MAAHFNLQNARDITDNFQWRLVQFPTLEHCNATIL